MNSISKLWKKLQTKEYRDGYAEAQLSIEIPFQIRALRKARGWTQAQLAERSGIPQARISHIEQAGRDPLSLRTLYRLSSAFDVGLLVQFVSFSELINREALFNPETFSVSSFEDDQLETDIYSTHNTMLFVKIGIEATLLTAVVSETLKYQAEQASVKGMEKTGKVPRQIEKKKTSYISRNLFASSGEFTYPWITNKKDTTCPQDATSRIN